MRPELRPSAPRGVHATRERYADQIQDNTLTSDLEFTSPSAAAAFLVGGAANGRTMWHLPVSYTHLTLPTKRIV